MMTKSICQHCRTGGLPSRISKKENNKKETRDVGGEGTGKSDEEKRQTLEFLKRMDNLTKYSNEHSMTDEEVILIRILLRYISDVDDKTGREWHTLQRELREANYEQLRTLSAFVKGYNKATCILQGLNTFRSSKLTTTSYWILERKSRANWYDDEYFKNVMAASIDLENVSGELVNHLIILEEMVFLKVFCERGINLNVRLPYDQMTPFARAVSNKQKEIVAMLMFYNADPHIPGSRSYLPYHLAVLTRDDDIAHMVLRYSLDRHSVPGISLFSAAMATEDTWTWAEILGLCDPDFEVLLCDWFITDFFTTFSWLPYQRLKQFAARYAATSWSDWLEAAVETITVETFDQMWTYFNLMRSTSEKLNFFLIWQWFAEQGHLTQIIDSVLLDNPKYDILFLICQRFSRDHFFDVLPRVKLEEVILLFVQHNAPISHSTVRKLYSMGYEELCGILVSIGVEPGTDDAVQLGYMELFCNWPDMANLTKVLNRPEIVIRDTDVKKLLMMSSHPKLLTVAASLNDPEVDVILFKRLHFPTLHEIAEHRCREVLIEHHQLENWAQLNRIVVKLPVPSVIKIALLMLYTSDYYNSRPKLKLRLVG